jgi:hypothetical protein
MHVEEGNCLERGIHGVVVTSCRREASSGAKRKRKGFDRQETYRVAVSDGCVSVHIALSNLLGVRLIPLLVTYFFSLLKLLFKLNVASRPLTWVI